MRIKWKTLLNSWVIYLIMFPFVKPAVFDILPNLSAVSDAINTWEMFVCVIILVTYLQNRRISKFLIGITIYELILLMTTVINGVLNLEFIHMAIERIGFCMLLEICLKSNVKMCVRRLVNVLSVLYLINLATIVLFPNGMFLVRHRAFGVFSHEYWFLGLDNGSANYSLPLVYLWTVYSVMEGYSFIKKYAGIILFSLSIYIRWTASSVVAVFAFTVLMIISEFNFASRILSIKSYFVFHICFFVAFVFMRIQNLFKYLIVVMLKKDITFSGRLPIWDNAVKQFLNRPILGWGVNFTRNYSIIGASHSHNFFLHTLYESGVFGFASFISVILIVTKKLVKSRNKYSYILSAAVFSFLFVYQMEVFPYMTTFFGLLVIAYHVSLISEAAERKG